MHSGRIVLTLDDLAATDSGISANYGRSLAEAAGVCLDDQDHDNPVTFSLPDTEPGRCSVVWPATNDRMRNTWNDAEYATEHGAMAIAILFTLKFLGYRIAERMKKGRGVDFLLVPDSDSPIASESLAWLEVSGMRRANDAAVRRRLKEKLEQTERLRGAGPAYVVVVEFSRPVSRIRSRAAAE